MTIHWTRKAASSVRSELLCNPRFNIRVKMSTWFLISIDNTMYHLNTMPIASLKPPFHLSSVVSFYCLWKKGAPAHQLPFSLDFNTWSGLSYYGTSWPLFPIVIELEFGANNMDCLLQLTIGHKYTYCLINFARGGKTLDGSSMNALYSDIHL